jgi:hypothetical protein
MTQKKIKQTLQQIKIVEDRIDMVYDFLKKNPALHPKDVEIANRLILIYELEITKLKDKYSIH